MARPSVNAGEAGGETPRTGVLADLISLIAGASSEDELRARLFPALTQFFGARRGALFLFANLPGDSPFGRSAFGLALLERHAPLHDGQIAAQREWQAMVSRADHGHVLAGPIVAGGEMIGVLGFTRLGDDAAFDDTNVSHLSALCLHVSTRRTSWSSGDKSVFALSPREREIVALVAQGKTNAQIGRELFVSGETVKAVLKAVFRKTNVSSRAQLVAVVTANRGS